MAQNHYDILGISRNATASEIQDAFRRLAKQHHPDHNPGDGRSEAVFREVRAAYECLKDPQQRATYDAALTLQEMQDGLVRDVLNGFDPAQLSVEQRLTAVTEKVALLWAIATQSLQNTPPAPAVPTQSPRVSAVPGNKWRMLRLGMNEAEVKQVLGEPLRVDLNSIYGTILWLYEPQRDGFSVLHISPPTGSVKFDYSGVVIEWKEPQKKARA